MAPLLLFDIDGVIRDVSGSYRRALIETVHHFSGWRPESSVVDALKGEGRWNNDWDASEELLRRRGSVRPQRDDLIAVFSDFYFGGDPLGDPAGWTGFIGDEPLLVQRDFFDQLSANGWGWGFVSGAEPPSARYVLQQRLGLADPPLIAMGDAPDKPDPTGLVRLSAELQPGTSDPVAYLGDTVADVQVVLNARLRCPARQWISLAVSPPHLWSQPAARADYEQQLQWAGADRIVTSTTAVLEHLQSMADPSG